MSDKAEAALHGQTVADVLARASAQAERYERRIAEQARLLGVQAERISNARAVLLGAEVGQETAAVLRAIALLEGKT